MQPPEAVIVVEGGMIQSIAIKSDPFVPPSFRVIDLDATKVGESPWSDRAPNMQGINIEKFTQKVLEKAGWKP